MKRGIMVAMVWLTAMAAVGQGQEPAEPSPSTADVRVMTFNLRYGTADDGANAWPHRRDLLIETIRSVDPDLLGTQETLGFQAEYLADALPQMAYVGRSREVDAERGEQCAVFYRRSRFDKLAHGHFWLSPTPDQPGSKGWDAALPRMATWVRLWDRQAQRPLVLLNTHFDHRGRQARTESAAQIRAFVAHLYPPTDVVVTGDFNSPETSQAHQRLTDGPLLRDAFRVAHPERSDDEGTFNSWRGDTGGARIDWILAGPAWRVREAHIIHRSRQGRFPSDHYPVTAVLGYGKPTETTQPSR